MSAYLSASGAVRSVLANHGFFMFQKLLTPASIAVLGASRTPGKVGYEILNNLIVSGFAGDVIPVNPSADEILGRKCYPDLKAAGRAVDLGVIAVPTRAVHGALVSCVNAGARAVIVITAGFREVGPKGRELEDQLVATCRQNNVLMLGPNCLGLINAHHRMNGLFILRGPGVRQGEQIQGARLIDLAPTIYSLMGVPIPQDLDGQPLCQVFTPGYEIVPQYESGPPDYFVKPDVNSVYTLVL